MNRIENWKKNWMVKQSKAKKKWLEQKKKKKWLEKSLVRHNWRFFFHALNPICPITLLSCMTDCLFVYFFFFLLFWIVYSLLFEIHNHTVGTVFFCPLFFGSRIFEWIEIVDFNQVGEKRGKNFSSFFFISFFSTFWVFCFCFLCWQWKNMSRIIQTNCQNTHTHAHSKYQHDWMTQWLVGQLIVEGAPLKERVTQTHTHRYNIIIGAKSAGFWTVKCHMKLDSQEKKRKKNIDLYSYINKNCSITMRNISELLKIRFLAIIIMGIIR